MKGHPPPCSYPSLSLFACVAAISALFQLQHCPPQQKREQWSLQAAPVAPASQQDTDISPVAAGSSDFDRAVQSLGALTSNKNGKTLLNSYLSAVQMLEHLVTETACGHWG